MTLADLDRLYAAATPGPWLWTDREGRRPVGDYEAANLLRPDGQGILGCDHRRPRAANAALIVALVNSWPAMREALRAAEELVAFNLRRHPDGVSGWFDAEAQACYRAQGRYPNGKDVFGDDDREGRESAWETHCATRRLQLVKALDAALAALSPQDPQAPAAGGES